MAKLSDIEKSINELIVKVSDLTTIKEYEKRDVAALMEKVEILQKQVQQHNLIIKIQTFIAGSLVVAFIAYLFRYL